MRKVRFKSSAGPGVLRPTRREEGSKGKGVLPRETCTKTRSDKVGQSNKENKAAGVFQPKTLSPRVDASTTGKTYAQARLRQKEKRNLEAMPLTWSKPTTATTVRQLASSVMAEEGLASQRGRREQHSRRELRRKESREAITASYARGKTACVCRTVDAMSAQQPPGLGLRW